MIFSDVANSNTSCQNSILIGKKVSHTPQSSQTSVLSPRVHKIKHELIIGLHRAKTFQDSLERFFESVIWWTAQACGAIQIRMNSYPRKPKDLLCGVHELGSPSQVSGDFADVAAVFAGFADLCRKKLSIRVALSLTLVAIFNQSFAVPRCTSEGRFC
jgi:hypothetical protein